MEKIRLTTLLFEDFELLDVFGPLEMFGVLSEHFDIKLVSQYGVAVRSSYGQTVESDFGFDDAPPTDILLVPGGHGVREEVNNSNLIAWLRKLSPSCRYVVSVCTGAALLARSGLLDGKRATSNKLDFKWVATHGEKVHWVPKARWIEDGKFFTSSGVSAGIDMSLALIAKLLDETLADEVARKTEYTRQRDPEVDPFAIEYDLS